MITIRSLLRNLQPVFFKLYEGQEEIVDAYGEPNRQLCPRVQRVKVRHAVRVTKQRQRGGGAVRHHGGLRPNNDHSGLQVPHRRERGAVGGRGGHGRTVELHRKDGRPVEELRPVRYPESDREPVPSPARGDTEVAGGKVQ